MEKPARNGIYAYTYIISKKSLFEANFLYLKELEIY